MITLLIIDDDQTLARVSAITLRTHGYAVALAESAKDGLRLLAAHKIPDLVLLDLGLPDMDGLDLLPILRKEWPDLPVIVVSGRTDTIDKLTARERGANSYLTKPFAVADLLKQISTALELEPFRRGDARP